MYVAYTLCRGYFIFGSRANLFALAKMFALPTYWLLFELIALSKVLEGELL